MKLICVFIFTLSMFAQLPSFAQLQMDRSKIMDKRLDKIDFYHLGGGIDFAGNENLKFGLKFYVGIGSNRNLYNIDLGLKLISSNLIKISEAEYISSYYMPFFISGSLNFFRRKRSCIYMGAELSYCIALGSNHHVNDKLMEKDKFSIANNYFSWQGKLGLRHSCWDFSFFFENDLSPALNQRYVYESVEYDYLKLYDSIFERSRIGLSITYNFRF